MEVGLFLFCPPFMAAPPRTGERLSWEAPLPEDCRAVVEKLSNLG